MPKIHADGRVTDATLPPQTALSTVVDGAVDSAPASEFEQERAVPLTPARDEGGERSSGGSHSRTSGAKRATSGGKK